MDEFSSALEAGIALVAKRERSEKFVRAALAKSSYSEATIEMVVERLKARHILDDLRLAKSLVQKRHSKGLGLDRIRLELDVFGIGPETIEETVSDLLANQPELAENALRERLKKSPPVNRGRAWRFLANKGFGEGDIELAMDRVLGASNEFTE